MNNHLLLIISLVYFSINTYSQTSVPFNKNLKAQTIKNELISFNNEKHRIFVLIHPISCHDCVNKTSAIIDQIQNLKKASCEVYIIVKGDSNNVLSNRLKISNVRERFKNPKNVLFDFNNSYKSILDIDLYDISQFPIIINATTKSKKIWVNYYRKIRLKKLLSQK